MSEPKHTPGPWVAIYNDTTAILPGWQIKADNAVMTPIASVPEPLGGKKIRGRSPYQGANARLIAAAPELLAALVDAEHELMAIKQFGASAMSQGTMLAVRAAIAKAEASA